MTVDETGVDELGINHWWQPSMEHLCSCSDSTNMHRTCWWNRNPPKYNLGMAKVALQLHAIPGCMRRLKVTSTCPPHPSILPPCLAIPRGYFHLWEYNITLQGSPPTFLLSHNPCRLCCEYFICPVHSPDESYIAISVINVKKGHHCTCASGHRVVLMCHELQIFKWQFCFFNFTGNSMLWDCFLSQCFYQPLPCWDSFLLHVICLLQPCSHHIFKEVWRVHHAFYSLVSKPQIETQLHHFWFPKFMEVVCNVMKVIHTCMNDGK